MRSALAALATLVLLTACDGSESLSQLRLAPPAEDPYSAALVDGYQRFSEQKAVENNWSVADYFAKKGLLVAGGTEVEPENAADWNVTDPNPDHPMSLTAKRTRLIAAIPVTRTTQPALTAQAMVAYDRYIEALANAQNDPAQIDSAGATAAHAIDKLGQVQAAQPGTHAPVSEPGVVATAKNATILYFPFDSDSLGTTADNAIRHLAGQINSTKNANVTINGHADRAGTEEYNQDLSQRRARFVERALANAGVPSRLMHYFAFGESDPAVPTDDDVREPKNRRVEIFLEH